MPRGWRIVKSAHLSTAFDGEGARLHGGRWNSPGTSVIYTAQSASLAALELLVHLQASHLLLSYSLIPADFDNALVEVVDSANLPPDWSGSPPPAALQQLGDQWVAQRRSVVLQVASAIMRNECNFLLNPGHPEFARVAVWLRAAAPPLVVYAADDVVAQARIELATP